MAALKLDITVQSKLKISSLLYALHKTLKLRRRHFLHSRKALIQREDEECGVYYSESEEEVLFVGVISRPTVCNSSKDGNFL